MFLEPVHTTAFEALSVKGFKSGLLTNENKEFLTGSKLAFSVGIVIPSSLVANSINVLAQSFFLEFLFIPYPTV